MSLDKVPASVKELAEKIGAALAYDDDGVAPNLDNLYAETLPEGLDVETVKLVQTSEREFTDALSLATGDTGVPFMKKNAAVNCVSTSANMGMNSVQVAVHRKIDVRAPGSTETKPKFGAASVKLTSNAGQKRGNLKRIMEHINTMGTEHLSS